MSQTPLAQMQQLESALLHSDFRNNPAALAALLAADFHEVSQLGVPTSRADVMQWLLRKDATQRWQFSDWQVDEPATGVRIVRYHAVRTVPASASKGARHLSIWRQQSATGLWQLWFHQSTRVEHG